MGLTGRGADLPRSEQDLIMMIAAELGVDARALAAIRLAESGGPRREYGVRMVPVLSLEEQAWTAASMLRNAIHRYELGVDQGGRAHFATDRTTGRLTQDFWTFFAAVWWPGEFNVHPRGDFAANVATAYREIEVERRD
jgi:hypothetical protein